MYWTCYLSHYCLAKVVENVGVNVNANVKVRVRVRVELYGSGW